MQKMSPEEEQQELPREHQELFQYHPAHPSAPSLAPVNPEQLPGLLSLHPVWSQAGKAMQAAGTTGKTAAGFVCEERVRQEMPNLARATEHEANRSFLGPALLPRQSKAAGAALEVS